MSEGALNRCLQLLKSGDHLMDVVSELEGTMSGLTKDIALEALQHMRAEFESGEEYPTNGETRAILARALQSEEVARRISTCSVELQGVRDHLRESQESLGCLINEVVSFANGLGYTAREEIGRAQSTVIVLEERLKRRGEHFLNDPDVRKQVWDLTDGHCFYCDVELTETRCAERPERCFHVDHIVPKASGGPDHIANFVPSCAACNTAKSSRTFIEFIKMRSVSALVKIG